MKETGKKIGRGLVLMLMLAAMASMTVLAADGDAPAPAMYATFASLVPPVVAIVLALITKEVYSSLFVGDPGGRTVFIPAFSLKALSPTFLRMALSRCCPTVITWES